MEVEEVPATAVVEDAVGPRRDKAEEKRLRRMLFVSTFGWS